MSGPEGASVATNALRSYARFLAGEGGMAEIWSEIQGRARPPMVADEGDSCAERIRALVSMLEDQKIPVEAWGAPGAHVAPVGPSGNEYILHDGPAPQHYAAFKRAYEAAHQAMVARLLNLAEVYEGTADAYRATAHAYDVMNDTES